MWDPYAEFQSATLPNGLTVHAAHWPGRPWEAVGFLIHSGAEHDPVGLEGLSHFVEHLVSANTDISNKEIYAFFEDCGGAVRLGTTNFPHTYYGFFVPADKTTLAKAFSIFGPMLLSARIEKCIERERQIIINEFYQMYPTVFKLDLDIYEHEALYTGYWLERFYSPLGRLTAIEQIAQHELQSHYDAHYTPANMSIICVGGMKLQELIELLSESPFMTSKQGIRTPLPTPTTDVALPSETHRVIEMSKYVNLHFNTCAYRSVAKIPGVFNKRTVGVVKKMLDEVLNEEVREQRAWTYGIHCSRYDFRHFHKFSINCDSLALRALDEIEERIEFCITSIGNHGDLLERIKRRDLASDFMIDTTGKNICRGALDDLARYQRIVSNAEARNDLERVTMSDIQALLQWLRTERRWTLIVRP